MSIIIFLTINPSKLPRLPAKRSREISEDEEGGCESINTEGGVEAATISGIICTVYGVSRLIAGYETVDDEEVGIAFSRHEYKARLWREGDN